MKGISLFSSAGIAELFLKEHDEVKKIIVEEIPLFPEFKSIKLGVDVNENQSKRYRR